MPARRKPTSELAASGAFDKDPARAKTRGADVVPAGELAPMPTYLSDAEKRCWRTIVSQAAPGVLKSSDWIAVLATTRLLAKLESGEILANEHSQLRAYLQEFAMTPKARPNVQTAKAAILNAFSTI